MFPLVLKDRLVPTFKTGGIAMKDSYLNKELLPQEINYLIKIIRSAQSDYINKNKRKDIQYEELEKVDLANEETTEDYVLNKIDSSVSATNIEDVFKDKLKHKAIKVLTDKEKLVLFSFYFKNKKEMEIAESLGLAQGRISQIKKQAEKKVTKKYKDLKKENEDYE